VLGISTFKINKMIDAALDAGAYGAKINVQEVEDVCLHTRLNPLKM